MKIDLSDRCKRKRCNKVIRKNKMAREEFERHGPFCSYHCQEWHRLESAQEYLRSLE